MSKIDEIIEEHNVQEQISYVIKLLQKIADKVDTLPDKRPARLWTPWVNSRVSEVPRGVMVDVMLAKGEVVPMFPSNELFWCDNLDDDIKIVAWRAADKGGGYGWSCPINKKGCTKNCGDYGCGN